MPVRLEPAALWSRVRHSTTEPLRSLSYIVMQRWCYYQICQRANIIHCDADDDAFTKSVKEPISYIVMQRWCYYQICQRANIIHCDADDDAFTKSAKEPISSIMMQNDAVTKSAKEQISYSVMQRWCCFQICQRANIIQCDAELMLLPNLPKSQYHTVWCRDNAITKSAKESISYIVCWDDAVTKSAKEPIPSIVIQIWCYYQICQRAKTILCDSEMMLLPNLPNNQYHPLWFRDDAVTKSAK